VTASKQLVDHALARFSTDNLSCMIVRLNKAALMDTFNNHLAAAIGVEGDRNGGPGRLSEAEKIVAEAKRKVEEDGVPGVGVSGSNSGKGHEPKKHEEEVFKPMSMEKLVEEEPILAEDNSAEVVEKVDAPSRSPRSRSFFSKAAPEEAASGK
jgi:protein phosphatase PTC1